MLEKGIFAIVFPIIDKKLNIKESNLREYNDLVDFPDRYRFTFENSGYMHNGVVYTAKTICLSSKGGRIEDMKLFSIDFSEWTSNIKFDESFCCEYFMNHQFLCIIFEETDKYSKFKDNKFLGFKRMNFSNEFIDGTVQTVWNRIRDLIIEKKLKETIVTKKMVNKL